MTLLTILVLVPGMLALPPVWHGALRTFLTWQASRRGFVLTFERIVGGPFGVTRLDGMRLRAGGTDLTVEHARFAIAWRLPSLHRSPPWMREIDLEGVRGRLDLTPERRRDGMPEHDAHDSLTQWLPANFLFQADDFQLLRDGYSLETSGFLLSGKPDAPGKIEAREMHANGRGFAAAFGPLRGQTFWKNDALTFTGLDLGNGVSLTSGTLDTAHLDDRRLDWECLLDLHGGEMRGQGTVAFARERIALEVAATLHHAALVPLGRTLGIGEPIDGQIEQASLTFRGDPDNLSAAQMWLSVRAIGFRWGDRRWDNLDAQAVVVNRRMHLNRFDLRQDGNRLSLSGECPLPPDDVAGLVWTGAGSWWRAAGFSCEVDARLENLHTLAELVGPGMPDLAGRMSMNGRLSAKPGRAEIEGYLNVEGTRLTICGAPLDYLHSTLLFRDSAMEIADVQATHDADYFTAHGSVTLAGEHPDRRGEARVEIKDMGLYAPALVALPGVGDRLAGVRHLDAVLRLQDGEVFVDKWDGGQTGYLLAR